MSKAKTNADELDLSSETETETTSSTESATSVTEQAETVVSTKKTTILAARSANSKMGLTKFLQLHPQTIYVTAILKLKYKSKVMTEQQWLDVVEEILDTEITA